MPQHKQPRADYAVIGSAINAQLCELSTSQTPVEPVAHSLGRIAALLPGLESQLQPGLAALAPVAEEQRLCQHMEQLGLLMRLMMKRTHWGGFFRCVRKLVRLMRRTDAWARLRRRHARLTTDLVGGPAGSGGLPPVTHATARSGRLASAGFAAQLGCAASQVAELRSRSMFSGAVGACLLRLSDQLRLQAPAADQKQLRDAIKSYWRYGERMTSFRNRLQTLVAQLVGDDSGNLVGTALLQFDISSGTGPVCHHSVTMSCLGNRPLVAAATHVVRVVGEVSGAEEALRQRRNLGDAHTADWRLQNQQEEQLEGRECPQQRQEQQLLRRKGKEQQLQLQKRQKQEEKQQQLQQKQRLQHMQQKHKPVEEEKQQQLQQNKSPVEEEKQQQLQQNKSPVEEEKQQQLQQNKSPVEEEKQQQLQQNKSPVEEEKQQQLQQNKSPVEEEKQQQLQQKHRPVEEEKQQQLQQKQRPVEKEKQLQTWQQKQQQNEQREQLQQLQQKEERQQHLHEQWQQQQQQQQQQRIDVCTTVAVQDRFKKRWVLESGACIGDAATVVATSLSDGASEQLDRNPLDDRTSVSAVEEDKALRNLLVATVNKIQNANLAIANQPDLASTRTQSTSCESHDDGAPVFESSDDGKLLRGAGRRPPSTRMLSTLSGREDFGERRQRKPEGATARDAASLTRPEAVSDRHNSRGGLGLAEGGSQAALTKTKETARRSKSARLGGGHEEDKERTGERKKDGGAQGIAKPPRKDKAKEEGGEGRKREKDGGEVAKPKRVSKTAAIDKEKSESKAKAAAQPDSGGAADRGPKAARPPDKKKKQRRPEEKAAVARVEPETPWASAAKKTSSRASREKAEFAGHPGESAELARKLAMVSGRAASDVPVASSASKMKAVEAGRAKKTERRASKSAVGPENERQRKSGGEGKRIPSVLRDAR